MFKQPEQYVLLLLAVLFPYILLCFYAHPIADDFAYAHISLGMGYWNYQIHDYLHWNGRYFSNALLMANPLCWHSFISYRLVGFFLIVLIPASIIFLLSSIAGNKISIYDKLISALLFTLLLLGLMPSLVEGVYWLTGAVTYTLGNIIAIIYCGFLAHYFQKRYLVNKTFHFALCLVLLFASIGFNEVLMLTIIAIHVLTLFKFNKVKALFTTLTRLLIFAGLCALVMILAPGNSERSDFFMNVNHRFFYSLGMTLLQMLRFSFLWISFIPLLLASFLCIGLGNKLYHSSPLFRLIMTLKLWEIGLALFLILFLSVFPTYWSTGMLGTHRTLNGAAFPFLLCWFLLVYKAGIHWNISQKFGSLNVKATRYILLLLAVCLVFSGNNARILKQLYTGEISGFNKEMNKRYALIETAKLNGKGDATVPTLKNRPSSLYFLDIAPGCNNWINNAYAIYFGVNRVCTDSVR
jgi:hypothetical protein